MNIRLLVIFIYSFSMYAVETQEFDVGAKGSVEYRVSLNKETKEYEIKLLNRNDYGVKVSLTAKPLFGDKGLISKAIIIGNKDAAIIGPFKMDLSSHKVSIGEIVKGLVITKKFGYYDENGNYVNSNQSIFVSDGESDISLFVGSSLWSSLDIMGVKYDLNIIKNRIQDVKVFGYGLLVGDIAKSNYSYLEIPSSIIRNGTPIWTLQIELGNEYVIKSIFKRYQIE